MNFGAFGTPERNFVFDVADFDVADFDETLPGPWEWDIKRLAASVQVAGRCLGLSKRGREEATRACVRSYRGRMSELAEMCTLERWRARVDGKALLDVIQRCKSHNGDDVLAGPCLNRQTQTHSPKAAPGRTAPTA